MQNFHEHIDTFIKIKDHPNEILKEAVKGSNEEMKKVFNEDLKEVFKTELNSLPKILEDFKSKFIFGPSQEDVFKEVINIYNDGIKNCQKEIEKEYSGHSFFEFRRHWKEVLDKLLISI